MNAALEPVRRALLADATAEAERLEDVARAEADARVAAARREAAALVERARAEGAEAAALQVAYDHAEARRHARLVLLAAQRDVYDELRRRALAGSAKLRGTPRYLALYDRLRSAAYAQLGPDARVDAAPDGGVLGSCNGRSVDYSLHALVERSLEQLGSSLPELWR